MDRAAHHRDLAARVADAHRALADPALLAFVSGSTVDKLVDERSDVDMSVVLTRLPADDVLQRTCIAAGATPWQWTIGEPASGSFVVSFRLQGIEVQIGYATQAAFAAQLDEVLLKHNPDTPLHKLAEGVLKAQALIGEAGLRDWQRRLRDFPEPLRRAMVEHALKTPTPWRAITQIIHRDTELWCRELQVDACYRMLLALAGLNRRYFTRFQVKRVHKLAAALPLAPVGLANRIDALLSAPPREAFVTLHALEGELLALIGSELPDVDTRAATQRLAAFSR